jgi:putative ABC transport system permease protein
MRRWWQLAIRNWPANPGRTITTVLAVSFSVGMVVWITCCYESLNRLVNDWVLDWVGRAHLTVESPLGKWGNFPDDVVDALAGDPGIESITCRLWWEVYAYVPGEGGAETPYRLDLYGIDPRSEYGFRDLPSKIVAGRALGPGDKDKALLEAGWAKEMGLHLGDRLLVRYKLDDPDCRNYEIIGLVNRRRLTRYQEPNLYLVLKEAQSLTERQGLITWLDLRLTDGSIENIKKAREHYLPIVRRVRGDLTISSAEAKRRQLAAAQDRMRLILSLLSGVAFLTALFIILSTLSMGMVQRMGLLGLMRCLGVTRWQLALLVPLEVMPLGAAGVLLGIPMGLVLLWATTLLVPEYIGQMAFSRWGLALAVTGGLATALVAAIIPMLRVISISPLAASTQVPPARPHWLVVFVALVGGAFLILDYGLSHRLSPEREFYLTAVVLGELSLYLAYALFAPLLVLVVGGAAVWLVAGVLGLKWRLLRDQVSRAPWRSGAICAGLMVGLSLIVGLLVHSESIIRGWQFPKEFPEAFVYAHRANPLRVLDEIRRVPGIKRMLALNEFTCQVGQPRSGLYRWLEPYQRFVAVDPDEYPKFVNVEYLEGNEQSALQQLRDGTGVLLTREFTQTYGKHVGDVITVTANDDEARFTVAGVVASPAIDIAVEFFQAGGEFQFMAVGSVIGTLNQARERFGRTDFRLLLLDFDLPDEPVPPSQEQRVRTAADLPPTGELDGDQKERLAETWRSMREQQVFYDIRQHLGPGRVDVGSVSMLKRIIDREVRQITRILTAIPLVALVVAALGVANLMTANVNARARQIALLRAVGTTRWQVMRLVLGEAGVLAVLGCGLGLALGFHLAYHSNYVLNRMTGFQPIWTVPWVWVGYGVAFTSLMCLVAGLGPARRAARSDVISALQVT